MQERNISIPPTPQAPVRSARSLLALAGVALTLVVAVAFAVDDAEARKRGRRGVHTGFYSAGYSGFSPYFYGPYFYGPFGPALYALERRGPEGGLHPALANAMGLAGIDLNIKPRNAEVFVDGRYVGKVSELDGTPSFLWLPAGEHEVAIYKGGYVTETERITVEAGALYEKKLRLQKGQSTAPPTIEPSASSESTTQTHRPARGA